MGYEADEVDFGLSFGGSELVSGAKPVGRAVLSRWARYAVDPETLAALEGRCEPFPSSSRVIFAAGLVKGAG